MNDDRAIWAESALEVFRRLTGAEAGDDLCDLLADLMHWSDRSGYGFNEALARARMHYEAETDEDSDHADYS